MEELRERPIGRAEGHLRRPLVQSMSVCCVAQTVDQARRIQAKVLGVDSQNDTAQRVLIENMDLTQRMREA